MAQLFLIMQHNVFIQINIKIINNFKQQLNNLLNKHLIKVIYWINNLELVINKANTLIYIKCSYKNLIKLAGFYNHLKQSDLIIMNFITNIAKLSLIKLAFKFSSKAPRPSNISTAPTYI